MINKWLPIIFGCHSRKDRSFKGFPICSRCTGELVGIIISPFLWNYIINYKVAILLMLPMIIDGFLQLLTNYESTNLKRFFTGLLFGISLIYLFSQTIIAAFNYGIKIGKNLNK